MNVSIQGEGQGQGPGGWYKYPPSPKKLFLKVVSVTPLFLFTSGHAINQIARNKHQKIPNHQEE